MPLGVPVVDADGALVGVVTHADLAAYRFGHANPVEATGTDSAPAGE
jgi:CBS domain-containing protein